MTILSRFKATAIAIGGICLVAGPASADVANFYKGKSVRVFIGFSAGGGFDAYGRLVARNIGRYIPGNPTIVASNEPGAGSAKALRALSKRATDGTVIVAFNPGLILRSMTQPKRLKMRFTDFAYLGSASANVGVCYMWHTTGVKNWADLQKRKSIVMGSSGTGTSAYIEAALLKNLFKLPVKIITGYPGSKDVNLAVERGEIDGNCGTWQSIPESWRKDNKINAIYTYSKTKPPGIDAPYLLDLAKNAEERRMLQLVVAYNDVFRPLAVSKKVPGDRLQALRDAFWETVHDKTFLAAAKKANRPVIGPARGKEMAQIVAEMYKTPPKLVEKISRLTK